MTKEEIIQAHLNHEMIGVWGRKYENEIGKAYIIYPEYTGFADKEGAVVQFTQGSKYGFVAYADCKIIHATKLFESVEYDVVEFIPSGNLTRTSINRATETLSRQNATTRTWNLATPMTKSRYSLPPFKSAKINSTTKYVDLSYSHTTEKAIEQSKLSIANQIKFLEREERKAISDSDFGLALKHSKQINIFKKMI